MTSAGSLVVDTCVDNCKVDVKHCGTVVVLTSYEDLTAKGLVAWHANRVAIFGEYHFGVRMKSLRPVFLIASLCLLPACATHTQAVSNTTHDVNVAADSTDVVGQPAAVQDCEQGCKEEGGNRYQFYLGILSAIIGG